MWHAWHETFGICSGYPVDGILQVEEEEEEVADGDNDSDDHDTYTVEEDFDRDTGGRTSNNRNAGAPLLNQHGKFMLKNKQILWKWFLGRARLRVESA